MSSRFLISLVKLFWLLELFRLFTELFVDEQSRSFGLNAMLFDELVVDEEEMDDDGVTIDDAIDCDEMDLVFLSLDSGCFVTITTDLW